MLSNLFVVPFVLALVQSINSAAAPWIQKCDVSNSKCLKESTQIAIPIFAAGDSTLGIETLEPFHIDKIDSSSPNLKLVLTNVEGTGLSQCIAKKVKMDPDNKITVKLMCSVDIKALYEIDGTVLILSIVGKGDAHVVLSKIQITVEAQLVEVIGEDGEKHWAIKDWNHVYELKDKSTIDLANLFNGNEVLGRAARELIATSSNEIITEIGPPIVKAVITKIVENVINFFKSVPLPHLIN